MSLPYRSIDDLPPSLRTRLPEHAQHIYCAAFNSAWTSHAGHLPTEQEEIAHRIAWAAVKRRYRKRGDVWVER